MIIWIYGQPGAGKTTLAKNLLADKEVKALGQWVQVDGDHVRDIFQNKDYSRAGRLKNGDLVIQLVKFLSDQGLNVIVSLVTPYQYTRNVARETFSEIHFLEPYYNWQENNRRPEQYMVADYEPTSIVDRVLSFDTSRLNEEQCIKLIKADLQIN